MKKVLLVLLVVFAAAAFAVGQTKTTWTWAGVGQGTVSQSVDTLGAHLGYGRGCVMCHAPHSGSKGNGITPKNGDPSNGNLALWGQDLSPLFSQTITFGGGGYPVSLPASTAALGSPFSATAAVIFCLSCHDGNLAKVGMMTGSTVEALPIVTGHAPTLLGNDGSTAGNYSNDHPVGGSAIVGCGGMAAYQWDCTGGNTVGITMNGTASTAFIANYPGSFWNAGTPPIKLATFGTTVTAVTCTTCHNQHSMNVYQNNIGNFATSFFIKGNYVPQTGGNNAAQFCRNCHGGNSNEMLGVLSVPTT